MQVTSRSVTSEARRAQVLEATIAVVAEEGFARASFARIAERAGLSSTRLISYHFAGKDELVAALVEHVVAGIGAYVGPLVMRQDTARGRLRAYIEGVVGYADTHRAPMAALLQVVMSGAWGQGAAGPSDVSHLEQILREGQERGELRGFDPLVVASTVQRAVEAVPFQLQADPDLDCTAYAAELVELFDRATSADP
ncbi:TetR/AcrR family transcriptional regulator [Nocardioides sp. zg-1228]|uniref:TetR/AcrR family transcriptional regulator n=1 Tax=Nocardioides sp. zg-1228 TaxID=2763008 RepID=UPI0016433A2B|nr:TetR family transcriptional regulator [Nocardioides sp. zg-1228]MBC2931506.1 TetR family transcriptional regulator [Nocardioides sp. zg-1228]QSF57111.1 TetR family transcriptional regulator [Nocardioides sp. zg-1228]